ncbi:methionyl-tRNA formyltransferase [Buchnera aphidicola (Mollitrichosiphum nigrofasciatum)]|uniref:methionyl-tRNA formyltransferase n=1 Tax=Buchnera aphidicola TaxID=9 RepID=UPI0031B8AC5C
MKKYIKQLYLYNKKKLKIVFAGTPNFAYIHLKKLIKEQYKIITVITKPDQPAGRGLNIQKSPVKILAEKNKIPILQPSNLTNKNIVKIIKKLKADIIIVIAYGIIIPKKILNIFPLGGINIHPSLLPKWRGPAPIQWAILKGDKKTGITIIQMNEFIDKGKIICVFKCKIKKKDTNGTLYKKLSIIGKKALIYILNKLLFLKKMTNEKQNIKKQKYAKKFKKTDGKINWNDEAEKIERQIKALQPWPGSYFKIKNKIIKIWKAKASKYNSDKKIEPGKIILINKNEIHVQTKKDVIIITELQFPGYKITAIKKIQKENKRLFEKYFQINYKIKKK